MYNLIKLEIKNSVSKKILTLTLIVFLINAVILYIMQNNNYFSTLMISLVSSMSIILLFISSEILSNEYKCDTYKYVYTGSFSRTKIVFLKLISVLTIAIICAIIGGVILLISMHQNLNLKEIFKVLCNLQIVFIVYTLVVFSTSFFILVITKSYLVSMLAVYIIFFDLFTPFVLNVLEKIQNNFVKTILGNIPYLYATSGARGLYYSSEKVYIMIFFSLFIIGISLFIFERSDL